LAASLAGVALPLSAIGLFGLMAQETSRRTREFGVGGMMLRLSAAVISSCMLASLLFEVRARTEWHTEIASLALLLVPLLACLHRTAGVQGSTPTRIAPAPAARGYRMEGAQLEPTGDEQPGRCALPDGQLRVQRAESDLIAGG
jgi:hypothetical protein